MNFTERLLKLADHLDTVPRAQLNMGTWKCGTVACAVGHAAMMPEFNAEGLRMISEAGNHRYGDAYPCYTEGIKTHYSPWDAAMKFFGLSWQDANHLFSSTHYDLPPTPAEVSARIRGLVEGEK